MFVKDHKLRWRALNKTTSDLACCWVQTQKERAKKRREQPWRPNHPDTRLLLTT